MDKKTDSRADPETGRSLDFPRSVVLGERNAIDRSLRPGCLVRKYRVDVFSQGDNTDRCRVAAPTAKVTIKRTMRARIVLLGVLLICTSVSTNFPRNCNFFRSPRETLSCLRITLSCQSEIWQNIKKKNFILLLSLYNVYSYYLFNL